MQRLRIPVFTNSLKRLSIGMRIGYLSAADFTI
jgi:hypothetical protein